jgi:hypothetical protein
MPGFRRSIGKIKANSTIPYMVKTFREPLLSEKDKN